MGKNLVSNEEIAIILYKKIMSEMISADNQKQLDKWIAASSYNKSLIDDISHDQHLKKQLADAYRSDQSKFWDIVIAYRSAMHNAIERPVNFWERIIWSVKKFFGAGKSKD